MAKKIDITEKLELSGNPYIVIGKQELEVNTDAATMLKIMDVFGETDANKATPKEIMEIYKIIFPKESRDKIEKMKLCFQDLLKVITTAQALITGADTEEAQGEDETHTTT